jgi:hypothetical protein
MADQLAAPKLLPIHQAINPLSESDRVLLESVITDLHRVLDLINRAEQAGMSVDDRRAVHEAYAVGAQRLHAHFFPPMLPAVQE